MEITLEKIELVKDRTGVTYADAKKALEDADGSVVDAIIAIEETVNSGETRRGFGEKGEALFNKLKELVKKGNVSKIRVTREDDQIVNIPVNAGILGICIAPLASIVALVAAFGFKCMIEVVKTDGSVVDITDAVSEKVSTVTELGADKAEYLKTKGKEYYDKAKDKAENSEIIDKAKDKVNEVADKVKDKVEESEIIDKAKEKVNEVADKIKKNDDAEEAVEDLEAEDAEAVEAAEEAEETACAEAEEEEK